MSTRTTITMGHEEDSPEVSLLTGHVPEPEFREAFGAEGWVESDEIEIAHEYWVENGDGTWTKSAQGSLGAVPVTVSYW